MNAYGTEPEHPESLKFYCRDCDFVFESPPDGTGYEQAECPRCNEVCMTVAFEQKEHDRHRNEATFFSILGSVTGLFRLHVHDRQQRRDTPEPVTIVRYEERLDAENDANALAHEGIEADLEMNSVGRPSWLGGTNLLAVELKVQSSDVMRAREILSRTIDSLPQEVKPRRSAEDITFDCEECGKGVSFPGQRRGKIETCPHCNEYIDVPSD